MQKWGKNISGTALSVSMRLCIWIDHIWSDITSVVFMQINMQIISHTGSSEQLTGPDYIQIPVVLIIA